MLKPRNPIKQWMLLNEFVLGINRRNLDFVKKYNKKIYKKYVDNKLLSKKLFRRYRIATPKVLKIIRSQEDLEKIDWESLPKSFVIKPGRGTHGRGILVLFGKKKGQTAWIAADGKVYTPEMIKEHISNILYGYYSMGSRKDVAFFEERIKVHPVLKPYSYKGIPDIRVIVFRKIPIMAMVRLPTKRSKGTANLHAGAVAVGIDMRYGITTNAIILKKVDMLSDQYDTITYHPDFKYLKLSGLKIPKWDQILLLAIKAQEASKMGYVGVDITLDRERGPLVIEVNARPGLGIQVANQAGLLERINAVKRVKVTKPQRAIEIAKALFGGEIEEEVEAITGKQIIGVVEPITLYSPNWVRKLRKSAPEEFKQRYKVFKEIPTKAKIDTGALYSSIDFETALRLGYWELLGYKELLDTVYTDIEEARRRYKELVEASKLVERPMVVDFKLVRSSNGVTIRPTVEIPTRLGDEDLVIKYTVAKRGHLIYPVIIGRRDLKGFLVDPVLRRVKRSRT